MDLVGERAHGRAEADGGEAGVRVGAVEAVDGASGVAPGSVVGPGRRGSDRIEGVGDAERALGGFLRARRGRVAPENVGIAGGRRRRVRGLRREELAQLAGISVDYYVRLEQGRATQPSPEVLDALAGALGLDTAERRHLDTLAGARRGPTPKARVSPLLQRVLDSLVHFPVFATNHRLDVVAWNALGAELVGGLGDPARRDPNNARFLFLDPASHTVHPDWEDRAAEAVGWLSPDSVEHVQEVDFIFQVGSTLIYTVGVHNFGPATAIDELQTGDRTAAIISVEDDPAEDIRQKILQLPKSRARKHRGQAHRRG